MNEAELAADFGSRQLPRAWGYSCARAVCKPLLLLWGQTLAFYSYVRKKINRKFQIPKYIGKWILDDWIKGMENTVRLSMKPLNLLN